MKIDNYIVLSDRGNSYWGPLASKFAYRLKLPCVYRLTEDERYFVFEVLPSEEVVLRAAQATKEGAAAYMAENCVLVWREAP